MPAQFVSAAIFLIKTLSDLAMMFLLLRLMLQWAGSDFYNPISQIVFQVTNPILAPLQRFLPRSRITDVPCLIVLLAVTVISSLLMVRIIGLPIPMLDIFIEAVFRVIRLGIYIYMIAIFATVIMSWIDQGGSHPVRRAVESLIMPVITPIRRVLPPFGGLDFAPFIAIVVLRMLLFFV